MILIITYECDDSISEKVYSLIKKHSVKTKLNEPDIIWLFKNSIIINTDSDKESICKDLTSIMFNGLGRYLVISLLPDEFNKLFDGFISMNVISWLNEHGINKSK